MYRARRSMYLKSQFPRVNGIAGPCVSGNAVQARNIANLNTTGQVANNIPNLIHKQNRTSSSIMPKSIDSNAVNINANANANPNATGNVNVNGSFCLKNSKDRTLPWRKMVQDMQIKPTFVQIESACNSSKSQYPQNRNIYNKISVDGVRVDVNFNRDMRRLNDESTTIGVSKKIFDFPIASTAGSNFKTLNTISKSFNYINVERKPTTFSEVLKGTNVVQPMNQQNKMFKGRDNLASDTLSPASPMIDNHQKYKTAEKEISKLYIFDTRYPSAFQTDVGAMSLTFGDFGNDIVEELQLSSVPIRNPRDPPCDRKKSTCLIKPMTAFTTNDDDYSTALVPSTTPISTSVPSIPLLSTSLLSPYSASAFNSLPSVGDSSQLSLEEGLRQQIMILKLGQLSVNQLYVLDLVEDLLVQHEAESQINENHMHHQQQQSASAAIPKKNAGFLDNITKNKQLEKCLWNATALVVNNNVAQPITSSASTLLETMTTPNMQAMKQHQQHQIVEIVDDQSLLRTFGSSDKKKKRKKKHTTTTAQTTTSLSTITESAASASSASSSALAGASALTEASASESSKTIAVSTQSAEGALRNGEKIKVEFELQLNQRLYEIREEICVVENDLYDQLADDTVNSEGEDVQRLHQISDEATDGGQENAKTNLMDEFTYAQIRNFLQKPKLEKTSKGIDKTSITDGNPSNECDNNDTSKRSNGIDRSKNNNKKKVARKSTQRS